MAVFNYKAVNSNGQVVVNSIEANSLTHVSDQLDRLNYVPLTIAEKKDIFGSLFAPKKKVDAKELIVFTKQFSTLFKAGVPLVSCLQALEEQASTAAMRDVIRTTAEEVQSGKSLHEALGANPKIFSKLYVDMIRVGETGGMLEEVLERLVVFLSHDLEIRTNIKKATRYPMIVLGGVVVAFVVLITLVVPRFVSIFEKMKVELPLPTKILIGINTAITEYWMIVIPGIFALVFALRRWVETPGGRRWWDSKKMQLPVFGTLNVKTYVSRFAKTFETLNRSGLPILQTLQILSQTVGNVIVSEELNKAMKGVESGQGLAQPLRKSAVFPPVVVQMIAIGEKSGSLDTMMTNIADYYDREVDYTVKNLTTLIEPMITLLLGMVILFIALAIFMPMWDMLGHMGK